MDGVFLSIVFAQFQSDFEITTIWKHGVVGMFLSLDIWTIRIFSPQWELEQLRSRKKTLALSFQVTLGEP